MEITNFTFGLHNTHIGNVFKLTKFLLRLLSFGLGLSKLHASTADVLRAFRLQLFITNIKLPADI